MSESYTFLETFKVLFRRSMSEGINTIFPAEIVKYDAPHAEIKPLYVREYKDGSKIKPKNIKNVPVMQNYGLDGGIKIPLTKGTKGICVCSKTDINGFLQGSDLSIQSTKQQFDLSDAIFITGLSKFTDDNIFSTDSNKDIEILYKNSKAILKENSILLENADGKIELNDSGQVNINNGNLTIEA